MLTTSANTAERLPSRAPLERPGHPDVMELIRHTSLHRARRLHATVAQSLVAAAHLAHACGGRVDAVTEQLRIAEHELRDFITWQQPPDMRRTSLSEMCASLGELVERREGVTVTWCWDINPNAQISTTAAALVYHVLREALLNAAQYSGRERVSARVALHEDVLRVVVEDDGCGFDSTTLPAQRGLDLTAQWAALVGARIDVRSTRGAGTTVSLVVSADPGTGAVSPRVGNGPAAADTR